VEQPRTLVCAFCGRHHREVRKLVAGSSAAICDECVGACNAILVEEDAARPAVERARDAVAAILSEAEPSRHERVRLAEALLALAGDDAHGSRSSAT
jgi:hypothetical protein